MDKIFLCCGQDIRPVQYNAILYILSARSFSNFYLANGSQLVCSHHIGVHEKKLPADLFLRISRSCIVNINAIKCITRHKQYILLMADGKQLTVAKKQLCVFKTAIAI
jgi:DNA-binding LytR/AlgR family response regulator